MGGAIVPLYTCNHKFSGLAGVGYDVIAYSIIW